MHCRDCDYPLWNLKARQCPECGAAFEPSAFEFVPQSVRFCCPHCDHPYYGTGDRGHVEPQAFACLRCGRPVTMDEMVLRPGLGVQEQMTKPDTMPWLDRRRRGRVRAWFQMIGRGLTTPSSLIAATPPESPLPQAWMFAAVCLAVFVVAGGWLQAWMLAQYLALMGTGPTGQPWFGFTSLWLRFAVALAALFVLAMVFLLLWIGTAHVVLRLTGRVQHSIRRTCQALLYSAGANVFTVVPCFGMYVGLLWWAISAILMLRRGHEVHGFRATLAVGALPGLVVLTNIGVYIAWIVSVMGMPAGAGPWNLDPSSPLYHTSVVNQTVLLYGQQHAGAGPGHAVELILADTTSMYGWSLTSPLVCDPSTRTTEADVPLGDATLAEFSKASRSEQLRMVSDVLEAQPGGVVAHRLGDFIFTYHGMTTNVFTSRLWVVVMLPDPETNDTVSLEDPVYIGMTDYNVTETTVRGLPALLVQQNRERAKAGLPPLPDLMQVTHDRPAVAPAASGPAKSQDNK